MYTPKKKEVYFMNKFLFEIQYIPCNYTVVQYIYNMSSLMF